MPIAKLEVAGVTMADTRVAAVTWLEVLALVPPKLAVNCTGPAATPVATPVEETVAIPFAELAQVAAALRFWVLPSEKLPVRIKGSTVPMGKLAPLGLMATEVSVAPVTTRVDCPCRAPELPEEVAVTATVPGAIALARPALLIVASAADELDQVTAFVRSAVLPSE